MPNPATSDWLDLTFPGLFTADIPADATAYHDREANAFCIRLATVPVTEVLVGNFGLPAAQRGAKREDVIRFLLDGFSDSVSDQIGERIPEWAGDLVIEDGVYRYRGVVRVSKMTFWMVQLCCHASASDFFIVHWNGRKKYLVSPVTRIFETFRPVFEV